MFKRNLTRKEFELIQQIETFIRDKHRRQAGHDYSHVLAVTDYALRIARAIPEEVGPFVLICGALFHDIGRVGTHTGILHGLRGATIARQYLDAIRIGPDIRDKIIRIVARHTPTTRQAPETIEERIVYDADALDRLGLMGMLRGLMGKKGSTQGILEDRMQKRLGDYRKLYFEATRRIGEELHKETVRVILRFREALAERNEEITHIHWPVRSLTRREGEIIQDAMAFIKEKHKGSEDHDYSHILAVVNYAIQIAGAVPEEVEPFVLICGALFHDIGWIGTVTGILHGLRGATLTDEYFAATGVSEDVRGRIKRVVVRHTISSHLPPETVEEKIVWDADGLEGLGLIGMVRGIIGGKGSTEDILTARIRYGTKHFDRLYFEESRRIGKRLQEETEIVVRRFKEALEARKEQIEELDLPYVEREPLPLESVTALNQTPAG